MKQVALTALKLLLVGGLIYWLVESGRLDFNALKIFIERPEILLASVSLWLFGFLMLGGYRWYILLRGLDIDVRFFRILHFQLIGFFFNTAVPGAVGGDIVKAVYVIKEQSSKSKTPALLTVLLDRVIGLACLFVMAGTAVCLNFSFFLDHEDMRPLAVFVAVGLAGLLFGVALVFFPHKEGRDPVARLLGAKLPGFDTLLKIYEALRCYRQRPWVLIGALLLSLVIQTASMAMAMAVTTVLTGQTPSLGIFATIYPVGVMATAIPLAPGGLGVGHVAFDHLFRLGGLTGGANVFNVTVLMQLALNLIGVIPYLLHRTRVPLESLEQELESVPS